jgi:hypothetical protein
MSYEKPLWSDLYNQIMNDRGSMRKLVERIPGFEGYLSRNDRRKADRMLRDHLAEKVQQAISRMAAVERRLIDKQGIGQMRQSAEAKSIIQSFHDHLITAVPGYSGFFAAINIDDDELSRLYGFDELQMVFVEKIDAAIAAFDEAVQSGEGIPEAIQAIYDLGVEANEAYAKREDILLNIKA